MKEIKKFTSSSKFNDYILSYMLENKLDHAYVSLRYGYTEKEMEQADFEIQVCGIFNFYELRWWIDWWEGQEFIEIASIITENEVIELAKAKEENND